jgi:hypothetical protein
VMTAFLFHYIPVEVNISLQVLSSVLGLTSRFIWVPALFCFLFGLQIG